jgi:hemoglobin/transferrin/lactoferrin receptor protein
MSHILNFQYSTSTDVPRYDRLTQTSGDDPKYGQWYYGPQERIFGSYTLQLSGHQGMYDQARIVAGYQHIEESRHDRRYRKDILNNRIEKVEVATLNADFSKILGRHEFRYGVEGTYNYVGSTAFTEDIMTGETGPLDTRYPDGGSSMTSAALYATDNFEINSKLILNAGLRYNYVGLHAEFIDTTFFPFPFHEITQKNNALTGNIGLIILPGDEWRLSVLGSSGFRVPNVDDLSKVFESVPGSVIVPNPDLEPEYTYNGEISLSKGFNDRIRLEGIAFYTLYRNAITTAVSTFDGQDSIYYNGELSQVITNVNANSGYLYGASASLEADVSDHFAITSTLNYTYGRLNTDTTDYPLDHIPPIFGKTSLILKINKFRGEFYSMYSGWKDVDDYNLVGEDNFANATEYGMPAWVTFNVRATYQINRFLQVSAALENIADQNYRVFASNISAPGRNLIVTLKGSF